MCRNSRINEYKNYINSLLIKIELIDMQNDDTNLDPNNFNSEDEYFDIEILKDFLDADIEAHFIHLDEPEQKRARRHAFLYLKYQKEYLPTIRAFGEGETLRDFGTNNRGNND